VALGPVISSQTQTILFHAPFSAYLLSEVHKTSSPGLESRTVFRGCDLCFCNLLFETKKLWSWRHSSIVLSFRATPPSWGLELITIFRSFDPSEIFLVSRNKHAKFGANRSIRSRKYKHEHNAMMFFTSILLGNKPHYITCYLQLHWAIPFIFGVYWIYTSLAFNFFVKTVNNLFTDLASIDHL
jgi:hypothetical protein